MSTIKTINVQHPSSATINLVNDSSGNVAVGNNLTVAGTSSFTGTLGNITTGTISSGNITSSGTVAATTGTLYPIVSGTAQASTSGTSITFSSIPSWAKRITVMFTGVSTNGGSNVTVRVGSGSVQTTGYTGAGIEVVSTNQVGGLNLSSGFTIRSQGGASDVYNGAYILSYFGSNTWVCTATIGLSSTIRGMIVGGYVALSGALDRVSITTEGGTDTFDAGSINIMYE